MGWKFWQKNEPAPPTPAPTRAPAPAWPTDAYGAVQALADAYVANDAPPFTLWRELEPRPSAEVSRVAEFACAGMVLALWFARCREVFGPLPARMAQDAFCRLLDHSNPTGGMGDHVETLIGAVDETLVGYHRAMEDPPLSEDGQPLDPGFHLFLAVSMLTQVKGAPYFGAVPPDGVVADLTQLLERVAEEARLTWAQTVDRISSFDAAALPWKWSAEPGAHERHLQRRCANPLFAAHRRHVDGAEVLAARQRDEDALHDVQVALGRVCVEVMGVEQEPLRVQFLGDRLLQLGDVHRQALRAGVPQNVLDELVLMRDRILEALHAMIPEGAVGNLESLVMKSWTENVAWWCQITGPDSPIPIGEGGVSLLCEPAKDVAMAAAILGGSPNVAAPLREEAAQAVREAMAQGHDVATYRENLAVFDAPT